MFFRLFHISETSRQSYFINDSVNLYIWFSIFRARFPDGFFCSFDSLLFLVRIHP